MKVTKEDGKNIAEFAIKFGEKEKIGTYYYHKYDKVFTKPFAERRLDAIHKNPEYTAVMQDNGRGKFAIFVRRKTGTRAK